MTNTAAPEPLPPQRSSYRLLLAEVATGIVLTEAGARFSGSDLPYLIFDSLDALQHYAMARVTADPWIEGWISDDQGHGIALIRSLHLDEILDARKRPRKRWWRW